MAATGQIHNLCMQKLIVKNYSNFTIKFTTIWRFAGKNMTFLTTWGCASGFVKMLLKFKMVTRKKLFKFYYQRCAGDFFKVLLKFKMAATDQLYFFGGRKNSQNLFGQFF